MGFFSRLFRRTLAASLRNNGGILGEMISEKLDPAVDHQQISKPAPARTQPHAIAGVRTFRAQLRFASGIQNVTVQADNPMLAKEMLEAQYGKGCISYGPIAV